MNVLSFFIFVSIGFSAMGQLDPFYYGTYVNKEETVSFTVYTMDEVAEDCFIVEKDLLKDGLSVQHWTGFGHCNGDDGRMEIVLENTDIKIPIEFNLLSGGTRSLTLFIPGANSEVYPEKNE